MPFCPVREPVLQPPHILLEHLNRILEESTLAEQLMTAFTMVLDPFDGTSNGPLDYERFQTEYPGVRFVRGLFGGQVLPAPPAGFDCIYSTSLLERVPAKSLEEIFVGLKKYLRPSGWSIHAFGHVDKGRGAHEHYAKLKSIVCWAGFEEIELTQVIERMHSDPETHYFLAESRDRCRGSLRYNEIRTPVCVNIQIISRGVDLREANEIH